MKINRLMQMIFVSASVCAALPAFAGSAVHRALSPQQPSEQHPTPQCGGDSDDGDDGDDGDGSDDGDDGDDGDSSETIQL